MERARTDGRLQALLQTQQRLINKELWLSSKNAHGRSGEGVGVGQ